jgi:hypothetical protein
MATTDLNQLASEPKRSLFLKAGAAALGLSLLFALANPDRFFQAYLFGYVFWAGLSLGPMAILMIHHLTGGYWGMLTRRILEASSRTVPMLIILFVPIALGLGRLYIWARPEAVAVDHLLQHKAPWLNPTFFLGRAAICFGVWWFFARLLSRRSDEQHADPTNEAIGARLRRLSAGGLLALSLTISIAAFDWLMSIEPKWYSTIFGAMVGVGMILSSWSFTILATSRLPRDPELDKLAKPQVYNDVGNLQLAFLMVWTYLSFCQFLLIYSANLPEEITWYLKRMEGGWQWVFLFLALGQFVGPFLALLSRPLKRQIHLLARVAAVILPMHLAHLYWMVIPAYHEHHFSLHPLDLLVPAGIGGLWLWAFLTQLSRAPLTTVLPAPTLVEHYDEEAEAHV